MWIVVIRRESTLQIPQQAPTIGVGIFERTDLTQAVSGAHAQQNPQRSGNDRRAQITGLDTQRSSASTSIFLGGLFLVSGFENDGNKLAITGMHLTKAVRTLLQRSK